VRYVHLSNDHWANTTVKDLPPAEGDFWRDISWTLSSGDGPKTVWIRFCDAQNYCSDPDALTAQITLATPPPTGQYVTPAAGALVRDEALLEMSVTDTGAGIRYVEFTANYSGTWHLLNRDYVAPYTFTWNLTAVPDEANIVLGGVVMDNLSRAGAVITRTITKDRTAPASTGLTTTSESGAQFARRLRSAGITAAPDNVLVSSEYVRDNVTLSLDAADNLSGVGTVQFHGYYGGDWHAIGADTDAPYELVWNLAGLPDGPLSVKATVPDLAGNSQVLPEVRVVKDTVAPGKASGLRLANRSGAFTNETSPAFAWNAATDDRSGVAGYFLAIGDPTPDGSGSNDWAISAVTTWAISGTLTDGAYRVALTTFDRAGNITPADTDRIGDAPYFDFIVDTAPPVSAVQALAAQQTGRRFTVSWAGSDNASGIARYDIQFRDGAGPWLNWLVGTTKTNATFTGEYDHQYAFRSRAHDGAGNIEAYEASPDTTTSCVAPCLNGQVGLQSHASSVGHAVHITLAPSCAAAPTHTFDTILDASGGFRVCGAPNGIYCVTAKGAHSLSSQRATVTVPAGVAPMNFCTLLEGDANNDDRVAGADFSILATAYNKTSTDPGFDARADFNDDRRISGMDFSLLATNYNRSGPVACTTASMAGTANPEAPPTPPISRMTGTVNLTFAPTNRIVSVGDIITFELRVAAGAQPVNNVELYAQFDPTALQVVDPTGNPIATLEADMTVLNIVLANEVDNATGAIRYDAGKLAGAPPDGDFQIATVRFKVTGATSISMVRYVTPADVFFGGSSLVGALGDAFIRNPSAPYRTYLPMLSRHN
jgi:hypothetical protein